LNAVEQVFVDVAGVSSGSTFSPLTSASRLRKEMLSIRVHDFLKDVRVFDF
jgi:hypothetical protein